MTAVRKACQRIHRSRAATMSTPWETSAGPPTSAGTVRATSLLMGTLTASEITPREMLHSSAAMRRTRVAGSCGRNTSINVVAAVVMLSGGMYRSMLLSRETWIGNHSSTVSDRRVGQRPTRNIMRAPACTPLPTRLVAVNNIDHILTTAPRFRLMNGPGCPRIDDEYGL